MPKHTHRYQPAAQMRDGLTIHRIVDSKLDKLHAEFWYSDELRDAALALLNQVDDALNASPSRSPGARLVANLWNEIEGDNQPNLASRITSRGPTYGQLQAAIDTEFSATHAELVAALKVAQRRLDNLENIITNQSPQLWADQDIVDAALAQVSA